MAFSIHDTLNRIHELPPEAYRDLEGLFRTKHLSRNEMLLSEGDRTRHCYYLSAGVIRVFYSNDGNEYNKTFFVDGTFPTAITALLTDSPSRLGYQALTECELVSFPYGEFRNLFSKHRSLESLMLRIMELEWIRKERHDIRMVTNDATTNYMIFREEFPGLENLIPQYHISSYLGVTPIQLSRIRAKLVKA